MDESQFVKVRNLRQFNCSIYLLGKIILCMLSIMFFFSARTLSKIETHLDTNNATEAWILLAIVAPNIQGHNPERVSKLLLNNLKYDMVRHLTQVFHQNV